MIGWSLEMVLDPEQEIFKLAQIIDWGRLEAEFGSLYCPDNGRPGVSIRLMAGLHFLKHTFGLSDEQVVAQWVLNPYWQFFCGEEFFQHKLPIHPSQMTRWRKRIGEAGVEKLLGLTIEAGKAHRPYEFGVKVSLAVTHQEGFCVGIQACPGNPFDGHTLEGQLDQVERLTGRAPGTTFVDKGYQGHGVDPGRSRVLISGTRKLSYPSNATCGGGLPELYEPWQPGSP